MSAMSAHIKQDPDATAPFVKPDPDSKEGLLAGLEYEDIYEDAGDLDFSAAAQDVWLSRIPRSLWEHWSKLDDDEEIQIGTIRIEGSLKAPKRVSLRLAERPDNQGIPKDYILQHQTVSADAASHALQNSYLFTEKNIPGAENRLSVIGEARSALYEAMKRDARNKERKKKWEPYVRKTVPKQTAIVGKVNEEFNCIPVENEEFRQIAETRALDALKPKREIVFIDKIPGKLLQPRNALPGAQGAFVQATTKPAKVRAQENKTTRMPQNELLDLIYQAFREYKYWPFKTLKARLRQPEVYLKQTLEMVAHLVKSGDFAMTWELKPEAKESSYANALAYNDAKAELPPGADENYDEPSEDDPTASGLVTDNDDTQFESVIKTEG